MTPEELASLIRSTLLDAAAAGRISIDPALVPDPVTVERPRVREHGDWATNVAMQLGKKAGMAPREFAQILADALAAADGIDSVEVAGPGFINIRLGAGAAGELARTIVEAGAEYGRNATLAGRSINLEYVSANPTGPVHLGGARWAAVGDSLARLMAASGAAVTREYYFNDHGSQIDRFSHSLYARAMGREVPEDGYGGQYIADIADQVRADAHAAGEPDPVTLPEDEAIEVFRARGVELMFAEIKERLHSFRADFDVFFHEDSLHNSGAVAEAIERLRKRGVIFDEGGAVWLRTTTYGDDKDRVLIKSDGQAAYFAGDVAYYLNKRERGADAAIYLLGADHHGYIGRMMAMCAAFGDKPGENLQILIGQLVNLVKDGEPVRMSKRAGNVVTIDDLVSVVGVDAARYSLARSDYNQNFDIDLALLASHTNDNPVYYVQYAHARSCNVDRNAAAAGITYEGADVSLLDTAADGEVLAALAQWPALLREAGDLRAPHRVAHYLEDLAATYHKWYNVERVVPMELTEPEARGEQAEALRIAKAPEPARAAARLKLNDAVKTVIAEGLDLLGVAAPDRM